MSRPYPQTPDRSMCAHAHVAARSLSSATFARSWRLSEHARGCRPVWASRAYREGSVAFDQAAAGRATVRWVAARNGTAEVGDETVDEEYG